MKSFFTFRIKSNSLKIVIALLLLGFLQSCSLVRAIKGVVETPKKKTEAVSKKTKPLPKNFKLKKSRTLILGQEHQK